MFTSSIMNKKGSFGYAHRVSFSNPRPRSGQSAPGLKGASALSVRGLKGASATFDAGFKRGGSPFRFSVSRQVKGAHFLDFTVAHRALGTMFEMFMGTSFAHADVHAWLHQYIDL